MTSCSPIEACRCFGRGTVSILQDRRLNQAYQLFSGTIVLFIVIAVRTSTLNSMSDYPSCHFSHFGPYFLYPVITILLQSYIPNMVSVMRIMFNVISIYTCLNYYYQYYHHHECFALPCRNILVFVYLIAMLGFSTFSVFSSVKNFPSVRRASAANLVGKDLGPVWNKISFSESQFIITFLGCLKLLYSLLAHLFFVCFVLVKIGQKQEYFKLYISTYLSCWVSMKKKWSFN